ncbi:MAG: hypothetical protein DRJ10_17085, partial [Bacteroidetes bacterium]
MKKLLKSLIAIQLIILNIQLINAQTTEPILRLNTPMHSSGIVRISSDSKGDYILTSSIDKTAKLRDANTGNLLKTFRIPIGSGKEGKLRGCALAPDGKIAAIGGWTGWTWDKKMSIYFFNTSSGKLIQRITGLENVILDLEFSKDGSYLAAAKSGTAGVTIFKQIIAQPQKYIKHKDLTGYGASSSNVVFDNFGNLATVCYDGKIRLYDKYFNLIKEIKGSGEKPYSVSFSADGEKIAVGYSDASFIQIYSGSTLEFLYNAKLSYTSSGSYKNVFFSNDGRYLYAGGRGSSSFLWSRGNVIHRWENAGKGEFYDHNLCKFNIQDFKNLPNGDIIYASSEPDMGRFRASSELVNSRDIFYKESEIINLKENNKSHFKVSYLGDKIAFTPFAKKYLAYSITDRRLSKLTKNHGLKSYVDERQGVDITSWKNTKYTPSINSVEIKFGKKNDFFTSVDISDDGSKIV